MADNGKTRWRLLCEQIQLEQDPQRFTELIEELTRVLGEKELLEQGRISQRPSIA